MKKMTRKTKEAFRMLWIAPLPKTGLFAHLIGRFEGKDVKRIAFRSDMTVESRYAAARRNNLNALRMCYDRALAEHTAELSVQVSELEKHFRAEQERFSRTADPAEQSRIRICLEYYAKALIACAESLQELREWMEAKLAARQELYRSHVTSYFFGINHSIVLHDIDAAVDAETRCTFTWSCAEQLSRIMDLAKYATETVYGTEQEGAA